MRIKELAPINGTEQINTEICFSFDEILFEDLRWYKDDIIVDGDKKLLIFNID